MEDLKIYDDEHDIRIKTVEKNKIKRKRRRLFTIIALLILVALYFYSDYSNVKYLKVKGNYIYTQQEILESAGLSYDSKYLLQPSFFIKYRVNKLKFIDEISISNDYRGSIIIEVTEKKVIGYSKEKINKILLSDSTTMNYSKKVEDKIGIFPLISGFKEKEYPELAKAFKNIDNETLALISEIRPYSTTYDKNMIELIMQDGNRIRSSYLGISLLETKETKDNKIEPYQEIMKKLQGTHVCIMLDEANNVAYKEAC